MDNTNNLDDQVEALAERLEHCAIEARTALAQIIDIIDRIDLAAQRLESLRP